MKSVVSLTWLGSDVTMGFRIESTRDEIFSVGPPDAEMMGRPGLLTLWIFGSRYNEGSLGFLYVRLR